MAKSVLGASAPAPENRAPPEGYVRYFADRQFSRQGQVVLFALACELYENFTDEEARGFLSQIGSRIAHENPLAAVATIDELEALFNKALADLDWGYIIMTVDDDAVILRQYAFPGHLMEETGAAAWRRAFSAILEGVYTTWLRVQGGGPSLEVKVKNDSAPDVLEFAYGV
jgi:hypothetical protein